MFLAYMHNLFTAFFFFFFQEIFIPFIFCINLMAVSFQPSTKFKPEPLGDLSAEVTSYFNDHDKPLGFAPNTADTEQVMMDVASMLNITANPQVIVLKLRGLGRVGSTHILPVSSHDQQNVENGVFSFIDWLLSSHIKSQTDYWVNRLNTSHHKKKRKKEKKRVLFQGIWKGELVLSLTTM